MTTPVDHLSIVPVEIKNWPDPPAKDPLIKSTSIKTYTIDPASTTGFRSAQITDFEPRRMRIALYVIDGAIAITTEQPITSPDVSTATAAPQGGYFPPATDAYEFFGPDALWINALSAATRVTVVKEYR